MIVFKCPFCGKQMTQVNSRLLQCNDCHLAVDLSNYRAWVTFGAPKHVSETSKFLEMLPAVDPLFVMSREPLFSEYFRLSGCKFFGCSYPSTDVECVDFNSYVRSKDYCLIAGKHLITKNLVTLFRTSLVENYTEFPLQRDAYPDSGFELWLAVMLESVEVTDAESSELSDVYFSSSLENMIQILWNKFPSGSVSSVTDEQAMYSLVFCEPDKHIVWENSVKGMRSRLVNYVKAIVRDVSKVPFKITQKYNLKKIPFITEKWSKDFLELYYKSMPSTALNQGGSTPACFDILNHEFVCDYFSSYPEESINPKVFMILTNTYRVLGALWSLYAGKHSVFGVDMKREWLSKRIRRVPKDVNEMVLEFWKEMEKELQHEKG